MSQAPPYNPTGRPLVPPPMSQTNGLGIAGFIVSLVGMVICFGLICPIGAVMSGIALIWKPRGFAIAGLILGVLGSLLWGLLLAIWIVKMPSYFSSQYPWQAEIQISDHYHNNNSVLPDDATGQQLVSLYNDQWGMPYDYRLVDAKNYEIISGGPDQILGTGDDVVTPFNVSNSMSYGSHSGSGFGSTQNTDTAFADMHDTIERTFEGDYESPAWHEVENTMLSGHTDTWGNNISYNAGEGKDYELRSAGPDGQMNTDDDIVRVYTLGGGDDAVDGAAEDAPDAPDGAGTEQP